MPRLTSSPLLPLFLALALVALTTTFAHAGDQELVLANVFEANTSTSVPSATTAPAGGNTSNSNSTKGDKDDGGSETLVYIICAVAGVLVIGLAVFLWWKFIRDDSSSGGGGGASRSGYSNVNNAQGAGGGNWNSVEDESSTSMRVSQSAMGWDYSKGAYKQV